MHIKTPDVGWVERSGTHLVRNRLVQICGTALCRIWWVPLRSTHPTFRWVPLRSTHPTFSTFIVHSQAHLTCRNNVRQGRYFFENLFLCRGIHVHHAECPISEPSELKPANVDIVAPEG